MAYPEGPPDERRARLRARFAPVVARPGGATQLCQVAQEVTAMSGAGIMLVTDDRLQGSVGATNRVSALIEELQWTLGEGPCVDAHLRGTAVLEPDLADPDVPRWQGFAPPAVEAGVAAIFGLPLRVGTVRLGALDLYRDRTGPLAGEALTDALAVADIVAGILLSLQADAPPGTVATGIDSGADFRLVVHQAAGMVSVQLGVTVAEAMVRLRAHAFGADRTLTEVAEDVVARRFRFGGPTDDVGPQ
jgi:hypothetical protein